MHFLVDIQQTGFIRGRHILDNFLTYKVGKEFAKTSKVIGHVFEARFA